MSDLNIITIQGRLTRDPEIVYTNSGKAVLDMSIASTRVWYDDNREKKEQTVFTEVRFWGIAAENVSKLFHKGKPIIVVGSLAQDKWQDKETGKERSKTLIKAESFSFCGPGPRDRSSAPTGTGGESYVDQPPATAAGQRSAQQHQQFKPYRHPNAAPLIDADDIPFD